MIQHSQDKEASHKGEVGKGLYNPDVLNCIANLSNDEVFTPPELANKMLDLLPQELFCSSDTTFLDPFTKSGVFLREIVKRLDRGLEQQIPDRQERIDHILHRQVFGIAITELTSMLARRSVYCSKDASSQYSISKFDKADGNIIYKNIKHTWVNGKCKYCGASQAVYDRGSEAEQYAYMFIHTDNPNEFFPNMKFDVIVGNPPYHLSDGGQAASSKPLYNLFVELAMKIKPRFLTIIIPARWYAGGKGLDSFRTTMLHSNRLRKLVDYNNSADCFPGVNIAGGVCYFLWDRDNHGECEITNVSSQNKNGTVETRKLNEFPILVRSNTAIHIIRKILSDSKRTLDKNVQSYSYFTVRSYERGYNRKKRANDVTLLSSQGKGYFEKNRIEDRNDILSKYKVIITYAMSGGNKPTAQGDFQVISSLQVLLPNEICTETYLILDVFDNIEYAKNMCTYVSTRIFRFLLLQALTSIHITKDSFLFVPLQDFSHPWTDEMLYKKYGLTEDEIAFIESMIRPME